MSTATTSRIPGRRRLARTALALVACAALLAGCGGDGGGEADAGGGDLDKVTFLNILPLESLTFSAEMIADINGYFKRHGLDVRFESTQGSAQAIQTILAGGALITRVGDVETMIAAGERNAPLVNIGTAIRQNTIRMVSSERAPIKTAEDFRGKLVGTPSEGGTSEITLDLVLSSAGIKPEETRRQVVGLAPGVFDLVQAGRVDAYIVSLDTSVLLQQSRPEAVVYDPNDAITSGAQVYVTSRQQMQDPQKQDLLRRYLLAIRDAMDFITKDADHNFDETLRLIGSKYKVAALQNPEVARKALRAYAESYTAGGSPLLVNNPERWTKTYEEVSRLGLVPKGLDPASWTTDEFVPKATS